MYEIKDPGQLRSISGSSFEYVSQMDINYNCFRSLVIIPPFTAFWSGVGASFIWSGTGAAIGAGAGLLGGLYLVFFHSSSINKQCAYEPGFYDVEYVYS